MESLYKRMYDELALWKFNESKLVEYSISERKKWKVADSFLIFISLAGVIGWFKYGEFKLYWSAVLILSQGVRLIRSKLFLSDEELMSIKNSKDFYTIHILELEKLYYRYYQCKYNSIEDIENGFNLLIEKERNLVNSQIFKKIPYIKKIHKVANLERDIYLNKIRKTSPIFKMSTHMSDKKNHPKNQIQFQDLTMVILILLQVEYHRHPHHHPHHVRKNRSFHFQTISFWGSYKTKMHT